ncbi:MAG: bifunctional tetrahydrofolate synthase/dihydrofolate synthase [Alkalimonas sp.]|nr:bifunctional tetrahydrofolate synthase/dihydrofolate synthase [Alkalimonas sp.]
MSINLPISSQSCQTLDDWLHYIEQSHPQHQIELGLDRVLQVAKRANLQQLPGQVVLIAGTNGKGTTARCMEQLLLDSGRTVAVYSSPHLIHFRERLRINQEDVADEKWVEAFTFVEQLRENIELTYFEFTTLAAFYLIKVMQPELCLIEVGLGGRLDATNIVTPNLSVLTTIDLDHQDWLGNSREAIGREKAGIFRTNQAAVVAELNVPDSVFDVAREKSSQLLCAGRDYSWQQAEHTWQCRLGADVLSDLPLVHLPLQNCATALMALWQLQLLPDEDVVRQSLSQVQLVGRMQWLQHQPAILLDVAHNPQSIAYLAQQLALLKPNYNKIHAVCGMLQDKVKADALTTLYSLIDHWYLVGLPAPRGATAQQLKSILPGSKPISLYDDALTGYQHAHSVLAADDLLLVFGSFVTVSAVLTSTLPPEAE